MKANKVVIIGGGLAGLSAGIELQKKGVTTEIYEKAPWPGGVCTSWTRKGFRFDGCIHWLVGTDPHSSYYRMYEEVKALDDSVEYYHPKEIHLEYDNNRYEIPFELEKFKAFCKEISPQDGKVIDELGKAINLFASGKMPSGKPKNIFKLIAFPFKYNKFLRLIMKYGKKDVGCFTRKLNSQTLKIIIHELMPENLSALGLIMMLSMRFTNNGGYPLGGSGALIERMANYYKELGGKLYLNSEVKKIVREGNLVKNILVGDKQVAADYIIAAGDAHNLLYDLLEDPSLHPQLEEYLSHKELLFPPLVIVSFGLNKQFQMPYSITFTKSEGIIVDGDRKIDSLNLRAFDFDEGAAPKGKSSIMVLFGDSLEYWENLRNNDYEEYKKQKQAIAKKVLDFLETKYPSITEAVEVIDVATPATYVHLNNLYQASYEGFLPLPSILTKAVKRKLEGIDNLMLCGQWVTPGGGIPPAISSGMQAAIQVAEALKTGS